MTATTLSLRVDGSSNWPPCVEFVWSACHEGGRRLRLVVEASAEVPAGDGPIRLPRLANLADAIRRRRLAQPVLTLDRVDDPEVADRQHVGPVQAEHEKHLRGPAADALHLRQRRDHLFVRLLLDAIEIE